MAKQTRVMERIVGVEPTLREEVCRTQSEAQKLALQWVKEWRGIRTTHTAKPREEGGYTLFRNGLAHREVVFEACTREEAPPPEPAESASVRVHEVPEPELPTGEHGYHIAVKGTVYVMAKSREHAEAKVRNALRTQKKALFIRLDVGWAWEDMQGMFNKTAANEEQTSYLRDVRPHEPHTPDFPKDE